MGARGTYTSFLHFLFYFQPVSHLSVTFPKNWKNYCQGCIIFYLRMTWFLVFPFYKRNGPLSTQNISHQLWSVGHFLLDQLKLLRLKSKRCIRCYHQQYLLLIFAEIRHTGPFQISIPTRDSLAYSCKFWVIMECILFVIGPQSKIIIEIFY